MSSSSQCRPFLWSALVLAVWSAGACGAQQRDGSVRVDAPSDPSAQPTEGILSEKTPSEAALSIYDELEHLIDAGEVSERQRKSAYKQVASLEDDGQPGYALARAALAGRLAEVKGLAALGLVREAAYFADASRNRDPAFRGEEATRMLGSLQALAGDHLESVTTEDGVELLENLVERRPHDSSARLRLGEALLALDDPESAVEVLCSHGPEDSGLRPSEFRLREGLVADWSRRP